jgi:DNA-binding transcriptional MerR regulator
MLETASNASRMEGNGMTLTTYLTTDEVAQLYRTSPGTVRYWRHIGYGPKGVKVGRRVLYAESDIRAWDLAQASK